MSRLTPGQARSNIVGGRIPRALPWADGCMRRWREDSGAGGRVHPGHLMVMWAVGFPGRYPGLTSGCALGTKTQPRGSDGEPSGGHAFDPGVDMRNLSGVVEFQSGF